MTEPFDQQQHQQFDGREGAGVVMGGAAAFAAGVLVGIAAGMLLAPPFRRVYTPATPQSRGGLQGAGLRVGG